MELEIIWSDFAENQLDEIFEYYNENASTRVAKKLIKNLLNEPKKLIKNPHPWPVSSQAIDYTL